MAMLKGWRGRFWLRRTVFKMLKKKSLTLAKESFKYGINLSGLLLVCIRAMFGCFDAECATALFILSKTAGGGRTHSRSGAERELCCKGFGEEFLKRKF